MGKKKKPVAVTAGRLGKFCVFEQNTVFVLANRKKKRRRRNKGEKNRTLILGLSIKQYKNDEQIKIKVQGRFKTLDWLFQFYSLKAKIICSKVWLLFSILKLKNKNKTIPGMNECCLVKISFAASFPEKNSFINTKPKKIIWHSNDWAHTHSRSHACSHVRSCPHRNKEMPIQITIYRIPLCSAPSSLSPTRCILFLLLLYLISVFIHISYALRCRNIYLYLHMYMDIASFNTFLPIIDSQAVCNRVCARVFFAFVQC